MAFYKMTPLRNWLALQNPSKFLESATTGFQPWLPPQNLQANGK